MDNAQRKQALLKLVDKTRAKQAKMVDNTYQQQEQQPPRRRVVIDDDDDDEEEASPAAAAAVLPSSSHPSKEEDADHEEDFEVVLQEQESNPAKRQKVVDVQSPNLLPHQPSDSQDQQQEQQQPVTSLKGKEPQATSNLPPLDQQQTNLPPLPPQQQSRLLFSEELRYLSTKTEQVVAAFKKYEVITRTPSTPARAPGSLAWPSHIIMQQKTIEGQPNPFKLPQFDHGGTQNLNSFLLAGPCGPIPHDLAAAFYGIELPSASRGSLNNQYRLRNRFPPTSSQHQLLKEKVGEKLGDGVSCAEAVRMVLVDFKDSLTMEDGKVMDLEQAIRYYKAQTVTFLQHDCERYLYWYLMYKEKKFRELAGKLSTTKGKGNSLSVMAAYWLNEILPNAQEILPFRLTHYPVVASKMYGCAWQQQQMITNGERDYPNAASIEAAVDDLTSKYPPMMKRYSRNNSWEALCLKAILDKKTYDDKWMEMMEEEEKEANEQERAAKELHDALENGSLLDPRHYIDVSPGRTGQDLVQLMAGNTIIGKSKQPKQYVAVDMMHKKVLALVKLIIITHLHSDHYPNIAKTFMVDEDGNRKVLVIATNTTKELLAAGGKEVFRGAEAFTADHITGLSYNEMFKVPNSNISVMLLDAHHCPGSAVALIFVEEEGGTSLFVHTGDMKAEEEMIRSVEGALSSLYAQGMYTSFKGAIIDDTRVGWKTPNNTVAVQHQSYTRAQATVALLNLLDSQVFAPSVQDGQLLVLVTAFELSTRITLMLQIAEALESKVYLPPNVMIIMETLKYDMSRFTDSKAEAKVHFVNAYWLQTEVGFHRASIESFVDGELSNHSCSKLLLIQAAGWVRINGTYSMLDGKAFVVSSPYSDHSSRQEVVSFLRVLFGAGLTNINKSEGKFLMLLTKNFKDPKQRSSVSNLKGWLFNEAKGPEKEEKKNLGETTPLLSEVMTALEKLWCIGIPLKYDWPEWLNRHVIEVKQCLPLDLNNVSEQDVLEVETAFLRSADRYRRRRQNEDASGKMVREVLAKSTIFAKDVLQLSEEVLKEKAEVWLSNIKYKDQSTVVNDGAGEEQLVEVNDGAGGEQLTEVNDGAERGV